MIMYDMCELKRRKINKYKTNENEITILKWPNDKFESVHIENNRTQQ